jgi:hypothetical protein
MSEKLVMKRHLQFLTVCLLLLALPALCSAKGWRNIFPLKTTRAEVLQLLGTPLRDSPGDGEYFEVDNQTVTIRWARPDCAGQDSIIDEKSAGGDALVYQITVKPKAPGKLSDFDSTSEPDTLSPKPKYRDWISGDLNCTGRDEKGVWLNCTIAYGEKGFGYSWSKAGVVALYYFPSEEEAKAWNQKHKLCSP